MNEWDIEAQREYAEREGRKEGYAEGKAEVAKAILEGGVPMDQIIRFTGLA